MDANEFGLCNVEGAILTGERHILVDKARDFFTKELGDNVVLGANTGNCSDKDFDFTIDCTFCALDEIDVDRFELCLTVLLTDGPTDKAVTIMDGPFPSLYPWDEERSICSLTSAKYTPICRVATWDEAKRLSESIRLESIEDRACMMIGQMAFFYPSIVDYKVEDYRLAIRAMPRSAADARLVDVVSIDEKTIRVRAGKIDAIFHAYMDVKTALIP